MDHLQSGIDQIYIDSIQKYYIHSQYHLSCSNKMSIAQFQLLSVIGKGSYAKVLLVKEKNTDKLYAMKIMKKSYIQQKQQIDHIFTERKVLISINHPFIIKLIYSFQSDTKLYFCLEFCQGGELFYLLQRQKHFNDDQMKIGLDSMPHKLFSPSSISIPKISSTEKNILIAKDGYIKLTDFGLSKCESQGQGATSICGTPEYIAPEVLLEKYHGKSVDWWALGCLLYEMSFGQPPFLGQKNKQELFDTIKKSPIKIPNGVNNVYKDLLIKLFEKNPKKRLGANGAIEIKQHQWFNQTQWSKLQNKELQPPFLPVIQKEDDLEYFSKEFTEQPIFSFESDDQFNSSNSCNAFQMNIKNEDQGFSYQLSDEKPYFYTPSYKTQSPEIIGSEFDLDQKEKKKNNIIKVQSTEMIYGSQQF